MRANRRTRPGHRQSFLLGMWNSHNLQLDSLITMEQLETEAHELHAEWQAEFDHQHCFEPDFSIVRYRECGCEMTQSCFRISLQDGRNQLQNLACGAEMSYILLDAKYCPNHGWDVSRLPNYGWQNPRDEAWMLYPQDMAMIRLREKLAQRSAQQHEEAHVQEQQLIA